MSINIAVILPSRGLVFSKTVEEMLRELAPYNHKIFWSHGRPIPDCFEIPTREILKDNSFTHLLTVEEDMIIHKGALKDALAENRPAVAYDYPVTGATGGTTLYDTQDKAFFTGCGFLLIKMDIVRHMVFPIWRVDIEWNMIYKGHYYEFDIKEVSALKNYGQQDIAMGLRLYYNGYPIYPMPKTMGQRKLEKRGRGRTNRGFHQIVEYTDTAKQDFINSAEQYKGLTRIEMNNGEIIHTDDDTVDKWVKAGLGRRLKIGNAEFYNVKQIENWIKLQ
jgi:hypothetical protein